MKNFINYYYNLLVSEVRKIDELYILNINNIEYEFTPYYGDSNKLYEKYLIVINNGRYLHEIIFNRNNSIISIYENKPYILLKKNLNSSEKIDLNFMLNYDVMLNENSNIQWKNMWIEKIDYYEYQIKEMGFKYKIVKKSFNYYIGLSELAISILNYVKYDELKSYIAHRRIKFKETISSFCNPLNIVIENRVRDISEYIKINYINEAINLEEVFGFIDKINLNRSEALLMLARLIYPSYYFDIYDKIIQGKIDENKISIYIEKNTYYESFLKKIYIFFKQKYIIPEIEWLEN